MEKLEIEKFSPTVAEIKRVVDEGMGINISDPTNPAQLKLVKDQRVKLRDMRTAITRQGKTLRQEAVDFQKAVIGKEKELIALIEPEEKRLSDLETWVAETKERADRLELLPKRKERLAALNDSIVATDDELVGMDSVAFEGYINKRLADKNELDRRALEVKEREIKEQEEKLNREKEAQAREEKVRIEERERAERAEKDRKDAEVRLTIATAEKEKAEKEQKEREEQEKKEKLEADQKYQDFLSSCGYTEATKNDYHVSRNIDPDGGAHITLYKKVGEIYL